MKQAKEIDIIKVRYPTGTRVQLTKPYEEGKAAVETKGTVHFVDDQGYMHMFLDDGYKAIVDPNEFHIEELNQNKERVIYVERKEESIEEALRKNYSVFHIGHLVDQFQGEDVSYHGTPFYETISIIQGENDEQYRLTDYESGYDRNRIVFVKEKDLFAVKLHTIDKLYDEIEELQKEIMKKKQELEYVKLNSNLLKEQLIRSDHEPELKEDICLKANA